MLALGGKEGCRSDDILQKIGDFFQIATTDQQFKQPLGITLKGLEDLILEWGRENLRDLTVEQVYNLKVKPFFRSSNFLEVLKENPTYRSEIRAAEIFVCFDYAELFLDFFDAIKLSLEGDAVLYIELFIFNDVDPLTRNSAGEYIFHLASLLAILNRTVLVFTRCDDSFRTPLSRLWCLLELFLCSQSGNSFQICAGPGMFFWDNLDHLLGSIDAEVAETFSEEDKKTIHDLIERKLCKNFPQFNDAVKSFVLTGTDIERITLEGRKKMQSEFTHAIEIVGSSQTITNCVNMGEIADEKKAPSLGESMEVSSASTPQRLGALEMTSD